MRWILAAVATLTIPSLWLACDATTTPTAEPCVPLASVPTSRPDAAAPASATRRVYAMTRLYLGDVDSADGTWGRSGASFVGGDPSAPRLVIEDAYTSGHTLVASLRSTDGRVTFGAVEGTHPAFFDFIASDVRIVATVSDDGRTLTNGT